MKIAGPSPRAMRSPGFKVIDLPGHAPGLIGLWRESDRLALVSDCFYTLDMWGRNCEPSVPVETYNYDTEQARAEPAQARRRWSPPRPGRGTRNPATGDVRGQLLKPRAGDVARRAPETRSVGKRSRVEDSRGKRTRRARTRPPGEAHGPDERVHRRGRQHADAARRADGGDAARVRGHARGRGRTARRPPRGRLAARGRAAVRAAGGELDDRGRADRDASASCWRATERRARPSGRGSGTCCASTARRTSRTCRRREPGSASGRSPSSSRRGP